MEKKNVSLHHLVKDDSGVLFLGELQAVEKQYVGTYADIPQQEETELIEQLNNKPWRTVVKDRFYNQNPWLYKIVTDPGRSQFLDILDYPHNGTYLDVGSGWGQITIPLAHQGTAVAFDLTKNRLDILNCIARQENVEIGTVQGNFLTFPFCQNCFDLVIFNGSLEWIASGRQSEESIRDIQIQALRKASEIVKEDGIVYIGIENSLGAKYLMGVNDDHTGIPHLMYLSEGQSNYKFKQINSGILPAKTWSLTEYLNIFNESGLEVKKVYCCFPDYKLIRSMVEIDEVNDYILSSDADYEEFDGSSGAPVNMRPELPELYKTLAKNNIAQYFCPSYGFVLKKKG